MPQQFQRLLPGTPHRPPPDTGPGDWANSTRQLLCSPTSQSFHRDNNPKIPNAFRGLIRKRDRYKGLETTSPELFQHSAGCRPLPAATSPPRLFPAQGSAPPNSGFAAASSSLGARTCFPTAQTRRRTRRPGRSTEAALLLQPVILEPGNKAFTAAEGSAPQHPPTPAQGGRARAAALRRRTPRSAGSPDPPPCRKEPP